MKKILILADGLVAEQFIERINHKRAGENQYTVVTPGDLTLPQKLLVKLDIVQMDPTSFSKMRKLFLSENFTMVFILLDSLEDTGESLKNIRRIDEKIRVVVLDSWNAFNKLRKGSTVTINSADLLSNHLYNHLPGVPIVAQNVGLSEGEIIEVLVPFGSTFAYRHVGSIAQIKWKIAAIYRNGKMIMPNNATMIKPQDTLLLIGRPQVLNNIFHRIHNRNGMFPEPFGKNLYLILDMQKDSERALMYLKESIHLLERLEDKELTVRIFNPGEFGLLEKIKSFRRENIDIMVSYEEEGLTETLVSDMQKCDVGLVFCSMECFENDKISGELFDLKKLVCIFGDISLYTIEHSAILMSDNEEEMESISSMSFYISETLDLELCLCNYSPDGDFQDKRMIVEHYETLSHIFHYPIKIEEKQVNPIREFHKMDNVLHIVPFTKKLKKESIFGFFSMSLDRHMLNSHTHPKLLIPTETD